MPSMIKRAGTYPTSSVISSLFHGVAGIFRPQVDARETLRHPKPFRLCAVDRQSRGQRQEARLYFKKREDCRLLRSI